MKWYCLLLLSFSMACRSGRMDNGVLFKTNNLPEGNKGIFTSRNNYLFAPNASGRSFGSREVIKELMEKNIPLDLPSAACADWITYKNLYEAKAGELSADARLYCSATLLGTFGISTSAYSTTTAQTVKQHLDALVARRYANYKVLYETLQWLKQGGETAYADNIKTRVLIYAKPLMPPPNANIADSPEVAANPAFKAEMEGIITRARENDGYIEKIKTL
jgi:hypothetical protein